MRRNTIGDGRFDRQRPVTEPVEVTGCEVVSELRIKHITHYWSDELGYLHISWYTKGIDIFQTDS